MKKLFIAVIVALMMSSVIMPTLAVDTGSVAGTTSKTTVTNQNSDSGSVKGVETTAEETKTEEKSFFAKYWFIILFIIVLGGAGLYIFAGKDNK